MIGLLILLKLDNNICVYIHINTQTFFNFLLCFNVFIKDRTVRVQNLEKVQDMIDVKVMWYVTHCSYTHICILYLDIGIEDLNIY